MEFHRLKAGHRAEEHRIGQSFPLDPRGIVKGSTEDDLYKALIGQYGAGEIPWSTWNGDRSKARGAFGFYESDVDEAIARNAGRRIGLPARNGCTDGSSLDL